jgi:hypothetical protein
MYELKNWLGSVISVVRDLKWAKLCLFTNAIK